MSSKAWAANGQLVDHGIGLVITVASSAPDSLLCIHRSALKFRSKSRLLLSTSQIARRLPGHQGDHHEMW